MSNRGTVNDIYSTSFGQPRFGKGHDFGLVGLSTSGSDHQIFRLNSTPNLESCRLNSISTQEIGNGSVIETFSQKYK